MLALLPLVGLAGFTLAICVSWGKEAQKVQKYMEFLLCVILNFRIFPKLHKILSLFLHQSHSPRMPVLTHPQGTQENVWDNIIWLSLLLSKSNQKGLPDFWLRWLFSPNSCTNLWNKLPVIKPRQRTRSRWRRKKICSDQSSPSSLACVYYIETFLHVFLMPDLKISLSLSL